MNIHNFLNNCLFKSFTCSRASWLHSEYYQTTSWKTQSSSSTLPPEERWHACEGETQCGKANGSQSGRCWGHHLPSSAHSGQPAPWSEQGGCRQMSSTGCLQCEPRKMMQDEHKRLISSVTFGITSRWWSAAGLMSGKTRNSSSCRKDGKISGHYF